MTIVSNFAYDLQADISTENILNSTDWIHALSSWMDNNSVPVDCDVDMIAGFFVEYASARRLSELMLFMKYLYRKVDCMNCDWHRVYYKIYDAIQQQIAQLFGTTSRLHVKPNFECFLCER